MSLTPALSPRAERGRDPRSGRVRGEQRTSASLISQRDRQQCVDLAAVEDDGPAGEFPDAALAPDLVEVGSCGKEGHVALLHRPHDQKIRRYFEDLSTLLHDL